MISVVDLRPHIKGSTEEDMQELRDRLTTLANTVRGGIDIEREMQSLLMKDIPFDICRSEIISLKIEAALKGLIKTEELSIILLPWENFIPFAAKIGLLMANGIIVKTWNNSFICFEKAIFARHFAWVLGLDAKVLIV